LGAAFADDPEMLAAYLQGVPAWVIGVRVRPPFAPSRFGVDLECPEEFGPLTRALASARMRQRLGLSFHLASSACGLRRWEQAAVAIIDFAATLERLSGRRFSLVDFGGGWSAEDFDTSLEPVLARVMAEAEVKLSGHPRFLIEPGKALAQPAQAVLSRVVHMRWGRSGNRAAVLDAGVADVPLIASFPHRLALVRETVTCLGAGSDELLGSSCMEGDVLSGAVALPEDLRVGDLIAICDAGAYDASMAHRLGRGIER
jgi:diaminopimelate decarboxylase